MYILVLALLLTGCACQQPCYESDDRVFHEVGANYPQCADKASAAENSTSQEDIFRDLICDPTCGPLYNATFHSLCPSPSVTDLIVIDYYLVQCRVNANGQACYTFYNTTDTRTVIDMSVANTEAVQECIGSAQGARCSNQCKDRLMAIRNYYGVCGSSLYNSTYFRSFNFTNITSLFSYQLWTNCGVSIPVNGGGGGTTTVTRPVNMTTPNAVIVTTITPNDRMQPTSSAVARLRVAVMLAMLCAMLAVWISD